tara:strand:+ start:698 stop:895 length:198 start_codon:yes stop_codon:yes gene_type:complete
MKLGSVKRDTREIISVRIKLLKNREKKLPSILFPKSFGDCLELMKLLINELPVRTAIKIITPANI